MYNKVIRNYLLLLFLVDLAAIPLTLYGAGVIRLHVNLFVEPRYILALIPLVILYAVVFYIFDFINIEKKFNSIQFLVEYVSAFFLISILAALMLYLVPSFWYGRGIWAIQIILSFFLILFWRFIFGTLIAPGFQQSKLLLIGGDDAVSDLLEKINESNYFAVTDVLDYRARAKKSSKGNIEYIQEALKNSKIDRIVVSNNIKLNDELRGVLVDAKMKGVEVYDIATFYENMMAKIPVYYISDFWIIMRTFSGFREKIYNNRIKRLGDLFISCTALLIFLPVLLMTAFIIKVTSPGPILYRQVRVGFDEEHFSIVKFRSMEDCSEKNGAVWACKNDPRVTTFGRFIRKTRIDELPQFWNILKGDMTLIGPRPERPEFVEMLKNNIPYYSLRHGVKPGVTGWAQVNYPYGASEHDAMEKLQYDLYYIRHLSIALDIRILLKTVRVVIFGIGAR